MHNENQIINDLRQEEITIGELQLLALQQQSIAMVLETALLLGSSRFDMKIPENEYRSAIATINLKISEELTEMIYRYERQLLDNGNK